MTAPGVVLDDAALLADRDPAAMLVAVATGAAQVREAAVLAAEAGVAGLADEGRPRAVVVCGMGGSGIAGDVLAAVAGMTSPAPVLAHRGHGLPAWVGAADLVVAVSCSGRTEETLSALEEAVRRGCRLLVVGAAGSPVEALGARGRAVFVPVTQGRQPRATVWALSTPLVLAGAALGLLSAGPAEVEAAAVRLEELAQRCRPDADEVVNPAKQLAGELTGTLPVVWGTSPLAGVAAYRFACQLAENAAAPALWGVLPEAVHNAVVLLDGRWAGAGPVSAGSPAGLEDLFRDRADDDDEEPAMPLRLVMLRDAEEDPRVATRADVVLDLARERGVETSVVPATGASGFERLASLVGLTDFASTYLALLEGTDPTPVAAIDALKSRASR